MAGLNHFQPGSLLFSLFFLLLLDTGGLDPFHFRCNLLAAGRGQRESLEFLLRGSVTPGLSCFTVAAEPLHVEDGFEVGTAMPVLLQQSSANVLGILTNALPWVEREVSGVLDGLAGDLLVVFVVEGQHSAQEQVGDDTKRPVVDFLSIGLLKEDFGCNIRECTERIETCLVWPNNLRKTEIDDLQVCSV